MSASQLPDFERMLWGCMELMGTYDAAKASESGQEGLARLVMWGEATLVGSGNWERAGGRLVRKKGVVHGET